MPDPIFISRGINAPELFSQFHKFVCPPTYSGGPVDPQPATRYITRRLLRNISLDLPPSVAALTRAGRDDVEVWIIEDEEDPNGRIFPSPLIRTVEGDVVHAEVSFSSGTHTIHWHGIEPTSMNDGVGHASFEGNSRFTYQFATSQAGTYFYHCHKNTVLHFENGLYGLLVVDPDLPGAPFPTGGPGLVAANLPGFPGFDPINQVVAYQREALWVPDEFDSLWHELGHDAFMQDCRQADPNHPDTFDRDGFLNYQIPDIFLISGVISAVASGNLQHLPMICQPITDARVAVTMQAGETLLIRLLNAGYTVQEYTIGTPADRPNLNATIIATDGNPFGVPNGRNQYSSPVAIPAGTPFRLTTARRVDLLLRPTLPGNFPVTVKHIDWMRKKPNGDELVHGIQQTRITVT